MRALVPALLLAIAALVAGALLMRAFDPATQAVLAPAPGTSEAEALAALRKDNAQLRAEIALLAGEITELRTALQERLAAPATQAALPAQAELPETAAGKPAREALDRYRAATGNQRPANPAELVPYFTDPQQAASYLKNRDPATGAKPERQQLKTELKAELKQRAKSGAAAPVP